MMITLPLFTWFVQYQDGKYVTNTYTGSLGTDVEAGCLGQTIFSYKVFVRADKEEGPQAVRAEYFWQYPWNSGRPNSETASNEFVASDEGIAQAAAWLMERCNAEKEE